MYILTIFKGVAPECSDGKEAWAMHRHNAALIHSSYFTKDKAAPEFSGELEAYAIHTMLQLYWH